MPAVLADSLKAHCLVTLRGCLHPPDMEPTSPRDGGIKVKTELTNGTQGASESVQGHSKKSRQPSLKSEEFNRDLFWGILISTENEQGEDDTMSKRHKEEDVSMDIKRKHQKKDPENHSSEQKISEKNNQVHREGRPKSGYFLKASISLNWKTHTLFSLKYDTHSFFKTAEALQSSGPDLIKAHHLHFPEVIVPVQNWETWLKGWCTI